MSNKRNKNGRRPLSGVPAKRAPFLKSNIEPPPVGSRDDKAPLFSFERMQDGSGNSVNCCQNDDRSRLLQRIFMLSKMSWRQIRLGPRAGFGSENISRKDIKKPVPAVVTGDVETFQSLHYAGHKRFIGYRSDDGIFFILWIDHDFSVYDHGP